MNESGLLLESTYIGEPITVFFDLPPFPSKIPGCPDKFIWQSQTFVITDTLSAWQDFERRGKYNRNMQNAHAARARVKGSLGVGKFYFRIKTEEKRCFDLYYDRAIKSALENAGLWMLYREIFNFENQKESP